MKKVRFSLISMLGWVTAVALALGWFVDSRRQYGAPPLNKNYSHGEVLPK